LCTCCRHYPGAAAGRTASLTSPSRISLPRKGRRVGLRIVLFEACSAFTRVAACTLALSPIRDTHSEGFSHFVASMTAPVASGWSGCRVGLAPTGKRRALSRRTPRAVIGVGGRGAAGQLMFGGGLLRLDARLFDDWPPLFNFCLLKCAKRLWCPLLARKDHLSSFCKPRPYYRIG
jgi:hypothetical protein